MIRHSIHTACFLALVWLASSCAYFQTEPEFDRSQDLLFVDLTKQGQEAQAPQDRFEDKSTVAVTQPGDERDLPSKNLQARKPEIPERSYSLAAEMAKKVGNPHEKVQVKMKLDGTDVSEAVKMFSLTLGFQYVIDPEVKGKVSINVDTEMTRLEVWQLFEDVLWSNGSFATSKAGYINIAPIKKMPNDPALFSEAGVKPNIEVRLIRLKNASPEQILPHLKPFASEGASLSSVGSLNGVFVVDSPMNVEKLTALATQLDVVAEQRWPQVSFRCRNADSAQVVKELEELLPILGFPVTKGGKPDGRSIRILSLDRLQVIVVAAPTLEVIDEIRRWVSILDDGQVAEKERMYFYDVQNGNAQELADTVGFFFSANANGNSKAPAEPVAGDQAADPAEQPAVKPAKSGSLTLTPPGLDTPVKIQVDKSHSRLIILTTPRAYAFLEAFLRRLDVPSRQVLTQVSIVDILLTDRTEFGFVHAFFNMVNGRAVNTAIDAGITVNLGKGLSGGEALSTITAVAGKENTRMVSSPQILTITGQTAEINVGERVPIVTQERSTEADSVVRSVQYQDTGTILRLTPDITAGGLVVLDVNQEVSSAQPTNSSDIDSPTIRNSMLKTKLEVEDGTTLILGGLISNTDQESQQGIPLLRKIPLLGFLFSDSVKSLTRRELLLVITVKVVTRETNLEKLVKRYHEAVKEFERDQPTD